MSYLEDWFFRNVILHYDLCSKYDVFYEYSVPPYFIDFAIPSMKLAVELDGACHTVNNKRIAHDHTRDRNLRLEGWKIYRIPFDTIDTETPEKFLRWLREQGPAPAKAYSNFLHRNRHRRLEERYDGLTNKQVRKVKYEEEQFQRIESVQNSSIDFGSHDWINEASELLGIPPRNLTTWFRKWMPDFFETRCVKPKTQKRR
jgi:hypothetical protein